MKLRLIIESVENTFKIYLKFLISILKTLKIKNKIIALPKTFKLITLLKSPHINKKAREQFLLTKYKNIIELTFDNRIKNFIFFLFLNKPKHIKLKLRKII
jgi:small subunit ribosomal protein S10